MTTLTLTITTPFGKDGIIANLEALAKNMRAGHHKPPCEWQSNCSSGECVQGKMVPQQRGDKP